MTIKHAQGMWQQAKAKFRLIFVPTCKGLTMIPLRIVFNVMLLTKSITSLILMLGWQQNMLRECNSELKRNLDWYLPQQIVTWFQIIWQSSCGARDSKTIFTCTLRLNLSECALTKPYGKNKVFFESTNVCIKQLF